MSDHCEEQEMEAEALAAIFDVAFEIIKDQQPFQWSVRLLPVDCGGDTEQEEAENFVAIKLLATIPLDYPETSLPELDIEILKGLTDDHRTELIELANEEAANNEGMPAIYAIAEALREWLVNNNTKGLDDASMYAQMTRRAKEVERKEALAQQEYESQKQQEELTQAEQEDLDVRKRRAEGTPCTLENFEQWKAKFEAEMAEAKAKQEALEKEASGSGGKKNRGEKKQVDKSGRLTGFQQFSGNAMNMEAIEAAAEEAENDEIDPDELGDVDEDLFDDDDDLDDLDFDDDEDEEEDYDDEEEVPDI